MQGQNSTICRLGFTYDVSKSPNWGNGKLVITHVYPYSSAKQAGLKVNDVIEAIDGIPVDSIAAGEIPGLLNPAKKNNVQLTISNLTESAKPVNVKKDCKRTDAITEDQLATAFAMYSLETTSEQLFVCPFTTTTDTMNYARYKTYSFAPVDENNRKLEETINACIEKEFKTKGLTHDTVAPDMLVETFYYYKKNPNFYAKENKASPERLFTYRYNFTSDRMEKFPFLSHAAAETDAEYLLQLGVRLIDKRFQTGRVLWECEANEMMSDAFRLDAYAQTHIPLMCMQYPYAKYNRNVQYLVSRKTYNYTGINYNINRLEQIMDITPNSPAHAAGLRMRDIIEKIDNQSMNHTAEEYTSAYKQFIMNTMSLRDPGTLFSDANGFRYCMHWDKFKYTQIAEAIQNPRNMAVFSYLYKYAPYVNPAGVNTCTFRVKRGKEKIDITVHPSIHTETSVIIK
jgi:C-terminal processing protease CtpA/Prc